MAPLMPARCPACGHTWQPPFIDFTDARGITLRNLGVTCPECGAPARMLEGTFNVEAGGIEMLAGPAWSWELVEHLGLALRKAVRNPQANPVQPVAEASPELADMITIAVRKGLERGPVKNTSKHRRKLTLKVLGALLGVVGYDYAAGAHNLDAVRTGAETLLRYVATHGVLPPPWG